MIELLFVMFYSIKLPLSKLSKAAVVFPVYHGTQHTGSREIFFNIPIPYIPQLSFITSRIN